MKKLADMIGILLLVILLLCGALYKTNKMSGVKLAKYEQELDSISRVNILLDKQILEIIDERECLNQKALELEEHINKLEAQEKKLIKDLEKLKGMFKDLSNDELRQKAIDEYEKSLRDTINTIKLRSSSTRNFYSKESSRAFTGS
jgi:uncharacterized protein YoxC